MGSPGQGDAASRRDALVRQLLEERRQRLQPKQCQGPGSGTWLLTECPEDAWAGDGPWQPPAAQAQERPAAPPAQCQADCAGAAAQPWPRPLAEQPLASALRRRPSPLRPRSASREVRAWPPSTDGSSDGAAARAAGRGGAAAQEHRPRSAPPARGKGQPRGAPAAEEREGGFAGRLLSWELRHKAVKDRQHQARQAQETREMEQCTFRPTINSKSEFFARRARACSAEPLVERLHREGDARANLRQKAKELLEADELYSHSFHPQINKSRPSTPVRVPIHLRAEEVRLRKEEHQRLLRSAENARSECSFRPQISQRSVRIAQRRRDNLNTSPGGHREGVLSAPQTVEERLFARAVAAQERQSALQDSLSEPSLAPTLDETSRRICRESVYFQGAQQDFLTRQHTFELARRRRAEMRSQHAEAECPFAPKISEHSRQLVSLNVDLVGETVEERVDRLAARDAARRERLHGALEQLQYRDCTFRPSLNTASQALAAAARDRDAAAGEARPDAVHERLYRSALGKPRAGGDEASQRDSECSFQPQLDQKAARRYAHVKPHYSHAGPRVMDSIKDDLRKRDEHLAELRHAREEELQEQCTFAPEPGRAYEEPRAPVPVSGLGRFFELRELAQKQQQEREEREKRAFRPETAGAAPRFHGVTIPEPFELSHVPARERPAAQPLECTFAPRTSEAASRELLKQLLQPGPSGEAAARPICA